MTKLLMRVTSRRWVFLCVWLAFFELFMGVIGLYIWTELSIEVTSRFRVTVSTGEDGWTISSFRNLGLLDPRKRIELRSGDYEWIRPEDRQWLARLREVHVAETPWPWKAFCYLGISVERYGGTGDSATMSHFFLFFASLLTAILIVARRHAEEPTPGTRDAVLK